MKRFHFHVVTLVIFVFILQSISPQIVLACSVNNDGSGDTCPSGQVCKNTTNCILNPNGGPNSSGNALQICGGGTCQAKAVANPVPQNPVAPAPNNSNPASGATCNVNSDGTNDTCIKLHPDEQCINTKQCAIAPGAGLGPDGQPVKICGGGTCAKKTAAPAPKEGDTCTRNVLDPVGTCGANFTCIPSSCTGDNLSQTCTGTCKQRPDQGGSCSYQPSKGPQGDCKDGFICKASANCSSLFCLGTCNPAPKVNPPLPPPPSPPCVQGGWINGQCSSFVTALGNLETDPAGFTAKVFAILLSFSGGIALLLIIRSGYVLLTSQGKPEQVQTGRDQLIAAIVGLVFLIFSLVILQIIGYDILKIPGITADSTAGKGCKTNADCTQGLVCGFNGTIGKCQ